MLYFNCSNYSYYFTVQGYVGNIKEIIFSKPDKKLIAIKEKYAKKVPQPLNSQFPDRKLKDEAINSLPAELFSKIWVKF